MDQIEVTHPEGSARRQLPAPLPQDAEVRGEGVVRHSGQVSDDALAPSILVPKS